MELGHGFTSVTIVRTEECWGCVESEQEPDWFRPDLGIDDRHRLFIEREVLINLAGDAAWRRLRGRSNWRGSRSDSHTAVDYASRLYKGRVLEKYLDYMRQRAIDFVSGERCWTQIKALAAALVKERTLSRDRAREVCRESLRGAVRTAGIGEVRVEGETSPMDDRASELADLLTRLFPPETSRQQSYLYERAEEIIAQIEKELSSIE
jgi:hypothetical protein